MSKWDEINALEDNIAVFREQKQALLTAFEAFKKHLPERKWYDFKEAIGNIQDAFQDALTEMQNAIDECESELGDLDGSSAEHWKQHHIRANDVF